MVFAQSDIIVASLRINMKGTSQFTPCFKSQSYQDEDEDSLEFDQFFREAFELATKELAQEALDEKSQIISPIFESTSSEKIYYYEIDAKGNYVFYPYFKEECDFFPETVIHQNIWSQTPLKKKNVNCHFGKLCNRSNCTFFHPERIPCRYTPHCRRVNCKFSH